MNQAKPFSISKKIVWEAYERVKANQGAAGVDSESIEAFEQDLKNNLYKIWNRMSSGTYFPPPVRTVAIPKKDGGERRLGIPTVSDRIAQTVAKLYLEPLVEPSFHPDSYGYRPRKSALDAVGTTRQRCWRYAWVIDLDIRGFFDNLDHDLVLRAVRKYTQCSWILLYLKRWLEAPAQLEDGTLVLRTKGTPQGGVVSPLVANIFLHLAFDDWMRRVHPGVPFERYADDIVAHCATRRRRSRSWRVSDIGSHSVGWTFIPARRISSTARMTTGRAGIRKNDSTSWDTRFALGGRRIDGASSSSTSRRR